MDASRLYSQLDQDFITPDMTDVWAEDMAAHPARAARTAFYSPCVSVMSDRRRCAQ